MSKNRVLLSVFTVLAIACMASETATAQLFKGRLLGRRSAACCPAPAPAPTCCGQAAPVAAPCCGQATPAPAPCCGGVASAAPMSIVAPTSVAAPMMAAPVSSCCGGSNMVYGSAIPMGSTVMGAQSLPMETGVVVGETILEGSETVQASPSDSIVAEETVESTTTADVIEPPASADASDVAPEEQN